MKLKYSYQLDYFDQVSGSPCANCECEPRNGDSHFCSDECQDEYEGNDGD
jgi:hypothetical protein